MKKEAEENAEKDKKIKEETEKINAADSMIFQTEKQLKEFGDKIPEDKKAPIEKALEELKAAHKERDLTAIDTAMASINTAWQAASSEMYNATQQQDGAPQGEAQAEENKGGKNDGEVTDVDFEEVK
jgi:molecular chaperone DnaK